MTQYNQAIKLYNILQNTQLLILRYNVADHLIIIMDVMISYAEYY